LGVTGNCGSQKRIAQFTRLLSAHRTNLDDLGKEDVLGELKALSHKLEDLIGYVITNLDDSIKKDANPIKKICGSCESDKIIYCNDCMIEMEANHGKYDKNNSI